jgi:hypothetical protein
MIGSLIKEFEGERYVLRSINWESREALFQHCDTFRFDIKLIPVSEIMTNLNNANVADMWQWLVNILPVAVRYQTGKHSVRVRVARRIERQQRALRTFWFEPTWMR